MRPARKEEPAGEEAGRKEKKGIASLRSRSNIDDSEMNSKQERQGNQSAASVSVLVGKANGYEAIAMTLRTPSPRPVRLIAEASRHPDRNRARPRSHHHPIAFHRPAVFFKHASPVVVYPLLIPVSFFVSPYLVSQSVSPLSISACVHTCRIRYTVPSGLARRVLFASVSSLGVAHDIAIARITIYIHHILVSLYPCIFVSFIYIAYIIFIIYTHRRATTGRATITKQPAVPSLVSSHQIE